MKVTPLTHGPPRPLPPSPPPPPPGPEKDAWWREVGLDFLENKLHLTPERINSTVESARDLGKSLAMQWHKLSQTLGKVLAHPWVENLDPKFQDKTEATALYAAGGIGLGVAGIEGLAGVAKLVHGVRHNKPSKMLEGLLDVTAGAAIASTIMGLGGLPLVLGPIAAGLGVARGAMHAVKGYQAAEPGKEVQGFLDSSRSAVVMCSLLGYHTAVAATVGAVIGPVAAAVQACRGYVTLRTGLEKEDKGKQINGLADIGTAVGLTLTFSGLVVPGLAITVGSAAAKFLYKVLPPVEWAGDKLLSVANRPLKTGVKAIELTIEPAFQKVRNWIDTHSPWQHGEDSGKDD